MKKYMVNDFDGVTSDNSYYFNTMKDAKSFAKESSGKDSNKKVWSVYEIEADSEEDIADGCFEELGVFAEYQNGEKL